MVADGELLAAWRGGDGQAGRRLVERYFRPISRFFVNKVSSDHEDLIQETFAACVRGRNRIRQESSFRSYLFSTAYNVLKTHYARNARASVLADLESHSVSDLAPGPSTALRANEASQRLLDGLRQIPLELQLVLEMRYWERMSSAEIGVALDLPPGTVRTRLRRGRTMLAARLEQSGASEASLIDLEQWADRVRAQLERAQEPEA
ncbi:MAG: sigma-70 family RNA polymerase sigma factor [Myxococcales bacterium]|nr:sigma-70 family RNA polymerase sigma factor [Myxococcales bacterium]